MKNDSSAENWSYVYQSSGSCSTAYPEAFFRKIDMYLLDTVLIQLFHNETDTFVCDHFVTGYRADGPDVQ